VKPKPPLRVLLVEDNETYRETIAFLLRRHDGIELVGEVATGAEAAGASAERDADVAVIDLRLPDMDGMEAAAGVQERSPATAVVFLSASAGAEEQRAAAGSGRPLVRKDEGIEALVAAIQSVRGLA
jgi:DNA-binding NarL/FixJ family response regulator